MHFLRRDEVPSFGAYAHRLIPGWTGAGWACATAKLIDRDQLELQTGPKAIGVLKADAVLARLPERMTVVGPDGQAVRPSKGRVFYVTVGTFNPFHLLTEF